MTTAPAGYGSIFPIGEIGWNGRTFVGPDDRALGAVFKLDPWEWMTREEFGKHIAAAGALWIEPLNRRLISGAFSIRIG